MKTDTVMQRDASATPTSTEALSEREKLLATYSPGLEGVAAGVTTISDVDAIRQTLLYRGYDICELADAATYESVVHLLLLGKLPSAAELDTFRGELARQRALPQPVLETLAHLPANANPMDTLRTGVSMLAHFDPDVNETSHEANVRKALRLVAQLPTLIAATYRTQQGNDPVPPDETLSHGENFLWMLAKILPATIEARVFDASLIVYAEHGFNASAFASRVTVSTLSDIYSGVVSAIGTLKGPLHGGANEEAMKMLLEIEQPERADAWIRDALQTKKKVMGFGHREYKHGDPRAPLLKRWGVKLVDEIHADKRWSQIADIVEGVMVSQKSIYPNVDFPTAWIYYAMGLPIALYTPIFAMARVAGWAAHCIEQLDNNRLIRPKAIYQGPEHQGLPSLG
jgi:citrate synthase